MSVADSYDLQYQVRDSNNTDWGSTNQVSDLVAPTYTSGSVTNGTRRIRVRVRSSNCRGTSSWSGYVELPAGSAPNCSGLGQSQPSEDGMQPAAKQDESLTGTESLETTDSSSTDSSSTGTGGDASSSGSTDQ